MTPNDQASRAHIPPDVKAAIDRRARELAAKAPPASERSPEFHAWMREVFIPRYREILARRDD
ncbi:hypothetical protein WDY80_05030 [Gordonia hongkongensis]|uniref:hypothetical protein n=1 Tax=Gordonia hongkongensis TaxID=1701090 RepID=UPI0030CDD06C